MADRRRINGPVGATTPPIFDKPAKPAVAKTRDSIRKIFLKTGITPSASGSAYLELENPNPKRTGNTSLKLMHRSQRGKDAVTCETRAKGILAYTLETALRGAIIADRWPKSGVDIIVTVVEGDQDRDSPESQKDDEGWDMMNVLSGCITVASAAIADAGIDCVDTVAGGVAALVCKDNKTAPTIVMDPVVAEHGNILAACCVAYLPTRDEITNMWFKGQLPGADMIVYDKLMEKSLVACRCANRVIIQELNETVKKGQGIS
ncbi:hypothetical protein PG994_013308 [Apiospora phragmitis]|uniref:Exoribonuclease phosphorolytic domain-containing protein n=1 Tax=Apiospora phragmitis TaxID=2905665 RepID=A0ABR1T897_9PEZI